MASQLNDPRLSNPADGSSDPAAKPKSRRWLKPLKYAVGFGLLAVLLVWNDNGRKLVQVLGGFRPEYILALLLVALGTNGVSSAKWGLFLKDRGHDLPWWRLFGLYLIGRFFSNFLPSMFGGDVARAYILGRQISSQSVSAASVVLERASGLVGLALLATLGCLINPAILSNPLISLPLAVAIAATVCGVIAFFWPRAFSIAVKVFARIPLLGRLSHKVEKLLNDIAFYRGNTPLLLKSLVYSFGFHMLAAVNVYVACRAIGFDPAFIDIMVVTPVILLLSMIPVSPNNIGWWEFCFSVLLANAGATSAEGLAVALVIRAVTFILSLAGGLLLLMPQFRAPPTGP